MLLYGNKTMFSKSAVCWFSSPVVYPVHTSSTPFLVSGKLSSGHVPAIMQDPQLLYGDRLEYSDQLFRLLMVIMIQINLQCLLVGDEWQNTLENPVINVLMCLIQLLVHRYLVSLQRPYRVWERISATEDWQIRIGPSRESAWISLW